MEEKILKLIAVIFAASTLFLVHFIQSADLRVYAETLDVYDIYEVKGNETISSIADQLEVSEEELTMMNHLEDRTVQKGDKLIVPKVEEKEKKEKKPDISLTSEEKDLLARLIHAEAKGEPFEGKVAVAEVVINRVQDERFPDTIRGVIYENKQFQPVDNGSINKPADKEAKKAVKQAMKNHALPDETVFFHNPTIVPQSWLNTREVVTEIGNHRFSM